jgi:hypothetical protein
MDSVVLRYCNFSIIPGLQGKLTASEEDTVANFDQQYNLHITIPARALFQIWFNIRNISAVLSARPLLWLNDRVVSTLMQIQSQAATIAMATIINVINNNLPEMTLRHLMYNDTDRYVLSGSETNGLALLNWTNPSQNVYQITSNRVGGEMRSTVNNVIIDETTDPGPNSTNVLTSGAITDEITLSAIYQNNSETPRELVLNGFNGAQIQGGFQSWTF